MKHPIGPILFSMILVMTAHPAPDTVPHEQGIATSLKGKLLVASPKMHGNIFAGSVILMVEHNAEGAFGLIVNKPVSEMAKAELFDSLGLTHERVEGKFTIFRGGPVAPQAGFILHDGGLKWDGTKQIVKGLAVSPEEPVMRALARGEGPKRYLIVIGYSGWAPGQLEAELRRKDWVTAPLDRDIIFDRQFGSKWKRAMENRFRTL
jgi:putative transcriptional regulator